MTARVRFRSTQTLGFSCAVLLLGLWLLCMTATAATITRSDDLASDIQRLQSLTRAEWLGLAVADLGEAWWLVHEAALLQPGRYARLTLAVRVAGKVGYINTRRLDANGIGPATAVPADLFQSFSGGNYSILVSGASPPSRPSNPLAWRGFVWEGLEAPNTRLGDVFDDVAVIPRVRLSFSSSSAFREAGVGSSVAAPVASTTTDTKRRGNPNTNSAAAKPASVAAPIGNDIENALPSTDSSNINTRSAAKAAVPSAPLPPVPVVIPRRLEGENGAGRVSRLPAQLEGDARTRHISQVNRTLRRRVAYLEALVLGRDLGRVISLDASVGDLLDVIMAKAKKPQRNVFLRIGSGADSQVGRVINATRYPLYKITGAGRGSHTILVDLEVRGPDGRTLLKSNSKSAGARAVDGSMQFRQVHEAMKLHELGITDAVWWPIPAHLK